MHKNKQILYRNALFTLLLCIRTQQEADKSVDIVFGIYLRWAAWAEYIYQQGERVASQLHVLWSW